MSDPFLVNGQAVISFSGGRTSAYMLWRILQAHDGNLPDDVAVCFANTGREMPATLDFVRDCGTAWNVRVRWLEYRHEPGRHFFEEISHNSASRNGEPFEIMLAAKSSLPNPVQRFCTTELKIRTMARFVRAEFDWTHWTNVVGLRVDEADPERAHKTMAQTKNRWRNICPLFDAGIIEQDVLSFWGAQSFDLGLAGPWEGNCDGCFLKGRGRLERMLLDHPDRMRWWADMEHKKHGAGSGGTFRSDRSSYAVMAQTVKNQGRLPLTYEETFGPCENGGCGV